MNKEKVEQAMNIINDAQNTLWNLHHKVKQYDDALSEKIWLQSIQIEHALLELNEELLNGQSYYENK